MTAFAGSLEDAARALAEELELSVDAATRGEDVVAVAFSGGLDSSILVACAKKRARVAACTAYVEGARDSFYAGDAARELGVEFAPVLVTRKTAEEDLKGMSLPFEPSLMDRSLWCVYAAVARKSREMSARVMLLGQMADELFGGYAKYSKTLEASGESAAEEAMKKDVVAFGARGRVRDVGACSRWVEPRFPFEAEGVVELGLSLPVKFKIDGGERKVVLRRAAELLGVPRSLARGDKKAAQYSSGVQRLLEQLTL